MLCTFPYGSGAPECIAGSAKDWPHRRRDAEAEILPSLWLQCDCRFFKEQVGGDYVVVLVASHRETRVMVSHLVVQQLARGILKLGVHGDFDTGATPGGPHLRLPFRSELVPSVRLGTQFRNMGSLT